MKETVGRDFDETSNDFTMDTLADINIQNFSERVSEISMAATMELAIETVHKIHVPINFKHTIGYYYFLIELWVKNRFMEQYTGIGGNMDPYISISTTPEYRIPS